MGFEIPTRQIQYDTGDIWERTRKINAEYTLEGIVLQNVLWDRIEYLTMAHTLSMLKTNAEAQRSNKSTVWLP